MTNGVATEPLHAEGLSASLTVRDLPASVAWYRDALGFTVAREMKGEDGTVRAVAVTAGNVRFMLNQDNGAKGTDRVKGQGLSMLITTAQSVDGIAARIKANGGTLLTEPADMPWGPRAFRVADPDGFTFAISSPMG